MSAMKLEDRVNDLERSMGEREGSFQFLSSQVSGVHKSLINFQSEVHERFDKIDKRLNGMDAKLDAKLDAMPKVLAEVIAENKSS